MTYPAITPVITSGTLEEPNAMAAAWATPLSVEPPLYGVAVSPRRYTFELIRKYGEFGVCFLPFDLADKVLAVGSISGRKVNKFSRFGLSLQKPEKIRAPLIGESLSALECKVVKEFRTGDHVFFVGEVVVVWVREDMVKGKIFDFRKAKHVLYLGDGYFTTNDDRVIYPSEG